jgi:DNA-directed RNA polymerase subunit H (RpoH/RPB5)
MTNIIVSTMDKNLQITLGPKKILERILRTFIEMLIARKVLPKDSFDHSFDELQKSGTDDMVFTIMTYSSTSSGEIDLKELKKDKGKLYVLKIIPQKITAISKDSGILDFLEEHKKNKKIIVVKDIGQKIYNQLISRPDTEVFNELELMYNILKHDLQPEFEPMSMADSKKFYNEYLCRPNQVKKMGLDDPVARMLGLKVNQLVRVIRPSESSGQAVSYRIVCYPTVTKG